MNTIPEHRAPEIDASLIKCVFGESFDAHDLLVIVPQTKVLEAEGLAGGIRQSLKEAYPLSSGEASIYSTADFSDPELLQAQRWPVAGVFWPSLADDFDKAAVIRLLARLRDLHANKVVHFEQEIAETHDWTMADSLALGFSRRTLADGEKCDHTDLQVYEFDMHCYKPAPDWLNSRHWANPEMWEKHRW